MFSIANFPPPPDYPTGLPPFVDDLKRAVPRAPHWSLEDTLPENALPLQASWLWNVAFPDPEHLLETAMDAVRGFVAEYLPPLHAQLTITLLQDDTLGEEAYRYSVTADGIILAAADTEGMRRALYYLIAQMRSIPTPALPFTEKVRTPWLKHRISRCVFGPIKRPPFNRDELMDDVDYYPENYLDRLASEGINGVFLTITWKDLAETQFTPTSPTRQQRIDKLKRTVEKCRRYGVRIWIFCIEPVAGNAACHLPEAFRPLDPDLPLHDQPFCVAHPESRLYIRQAVCSIFRDVPHLGGMLNITLGERATSCLSWMLERSEDSVHCRTACGLSHAEIFAALHNSMQDGIRDAGSTAQVINWVYQPTPPQQPEWLFRLTENLPQDAILQFNFETGVCKAQSGKVFVGGDYWQSCVGPSDRFGRMAAAAWGRCQLSAKIQVACSHELATLPFIPVPGLLYRKYKAMRQLGVSHVMQCWYFGNYPGLMNEAAGELAFETFEDTENDFLRRLALPTWGADLAPAVANAWQAFSVAYENYPAENMFQYYGPVHDGVVWPLHLQLEHLGLNRSWKPEKAPSGDAIGECMLGHTAEEDSLLLREMADTWNDALAQLNACADTFRLDSEQSRELGLYEAVGTLISSAANIMTFYTLRNAVRHQEQPCVDLLKEMAECVQAEITNTRRMTHLCLNDPRLGFHSEAEVYKFFRAKLQWRQQALEAMLPDLQNLTTLPQAEVRSLLAWKGQALRLNTHYESKTFAWCVTREKNDLVFTLDFKAQPFETLSDNSMLMLQDEDGAHMPAQVELDGTMVFIPYGRTQGISVTKDGRRRIVRVPLTRFAYPNALFVGICRVWTTATGETSGENFPDVPWNPRDPRLALNHFTPQQTSLLVIHSLA